LTVEGVDSMREGRDSEDLSLLCVNIRQWLCVWSRQWWYHK